MMLNVKIDYMSDEDWQKIDWQAFRAVWPNKTPEEQPKYHWDFRAETRLHVDEAVALSALGVELKILPPSDQMLVKLRDQKEWRASETVQPVDLKTGAAVQIHVPNLGLLTITHVEVLDDCCTDKLQEYLDEGWRILAVCPPNAQRRPDYVVGRADS